MNPQVLALLDHALLSGRQVAHVQDTIIAQRARPDEIVSGNGTEPPCNAIVSWVDRTGVG